MQRSSPLVISPENATDGPMVVMMPERREGSSILDALLVRAGVVKLADAPDSKSGGVHPPCGFDSHLRHHLNPPPGNTLARPADRHARAELLPEGACLTNRDRGQKDLCRRDFHRR